MDKLKLNISVLKKVSHLVARRSSVSKMIAEILDILHSEMKVLRVAITLREKDVLVIRTSEGFNNGESGRGVYKIGEGITGQVAKTGIAQIIPDIRKEKNFLNKTGTKDFSDKNVAFVCVPVIYMDDIIRTISVDRFVDKKTNLDDDLHLLEITANIMAEAIFAASVQRQEREKLISENMRLQLELDNIN